MRRNPVALLTGAACAVGLIGLTVLISQHSVQGADAAGLAPRINPQSGLATFAIAISVATWPVIIYALILAMAIWAWTRRLRNLAMAQVAAVAWGWGVTEVMKFWLPRARPEPIGDNLLTLSGPGFPSAHLVAVTIAMWMVAASLVVNRRSKTTVGIGVGVAGVVWVLVFLARWLVQAEWNSDLLAGILLGSAAGALAIWLADVHILDFRVPIFANNASVEDQNWAYFADADQAADPTKTAEFSAVAPTAPHSGSEVWDELAWAEQELTAESDSLQRSEEKSAFADADTLYWPWRDDQSDHPDLQTSPPRNAMEDTLGYLAYHDTPTGKLPKISADQESPAETEATTDQVDLEKSDAVTDELSDASSQGGDDPESGVAPIDAADGRTQSTSVSEQVKESDQQTDQSDSQPGHVPTSATASGAVRPEQLPRSAPTSLSTPPTGRTGGSSQQPTGEQEPQPKADEFAPAEPVATQAVAKSPTAAPLPGLTVAIPGAVATDMAAAVPGLAMAALAGGKLPTQQSTPVPHELKRVAIIVNPAKVTDLESLRRHTHYEIERCGWSEPVWLETTPEEDGRRLAQQAVADGVDLVMVAGGDGTTRVVCGALAGTGVPLAILPAGTTNLLARNLDIPLDEPQALQIAFRGEAKPCDLVKFIPDDDPARTEYSAVIGGIGLDGSVFANTDDRLKKTIGMVAYVVSAAQQYKAHQVDENVDLHASITIDDQETIDQDAVVISFGNVGMVPGGVEIIPDAAPDDGLLNLLIASPDSLSNWAQLLGDVLTKQSNWHGVSLKLASKVRVELAKPRAFQLDGDAMGECRTLEAVVQPGALQIMRVAK